DIVIDSDSRTPVSDRSTHKLINVCCHPVYFVPVRLEFAETLETIQRGGEFDAGSREVLAHLPGRVGDGLDAVEVDFVAGFLRKVDHVVKARSQQQDVAFIDGRDKRAVDKVVYR